jgi:hypothetical protein
MGDGRNGTTFPRLTLAVAMRRAREQAGVTMHAAAAEIGGSEQTIRRMEQGTSSTRRANVAVLTALYGLAEPTARVLTDLAEQTRASDQRWHAYGARIVPAWFALYAALEATAARIRMYDPLLVPGLLQSAGYARAVIQAGLPEVGEDEMAARLRLRLDRQSLLSRFPPPRIEVVVGESVLLAEPGDEVMREQVWQLLTAAETADVTVRVLPSRISPHRASVAGAFTVLDFPADARHTPPVTVYSENLTGALYLTDPDEVGRYEDVWAALDVQAESGSATVELLARRLKEITDRER